MLQRVLFCFAALLAVPAAALAQTAPPSAAAAAAPARGPQSYDSFVRDAAVSPGLLPVIHKDGKVYLVVSRDQLEQDFIQTAVPYSGLGGFGPAEGEPYVAPARIMRFERVDDNIVMRWPNTFALTNPNSPQELGLRASLPSSVVGVTPIVAEDRTRGLMVFAAATFLGDVANLNAVFEQTVPNPMHGYRLDPTRSFFTDAKAFPANTVLRVSQTWASSSPNTIDNAPDPRSIEVRMTYNFIAAPNDGYMARIADPRVGYFEQPLLNFRSDSAPTRNVYYVARWNFMPEHPGQPSVAKNPLVFYLSSNIPSEYRSTVKSALLEWNRAFAKIGIQNAVQVQQQPDDKTWDPDDIRHNIVRWISTTAPQYGAEALIVTDPRSGEEINVGVNVDAVEGLAGNTYRYLIAPARGLADNASLERRFALEALRATVLHESGHDLGLQHNFIGSTAYTAKQLQSSGFTARYGVGNSVMEYSPVNLWPKGTPQGDYEQQVLGPYDYYAMQYGYAYVPNAKTPEQELPTLRRWASAWSNPYYRFASDEDVSFQSGHAIDPRVAMFDLTNKPLQWCGVQMTMMHGLMDSVNSRFPAAGMTYEDARRAFMSPLRAYIRCAQMPAHTIGGEYLSRSLSIDRGSAPPLTAVPRSQEAAAWQMLAKNLFADDAWHFNPNVLNRLTYDEVSAFTDASWAYAPAGRHDVAVVQVAANAQDQVLSELFAPLTLKRIDDLGTKYRAGSTMSIADLFAWSRTGIFGDIANGRVGQSGEVRRNLQMRFAKRLAQMWTAPHAGTPNDAQSLARLQLVRLDGDIHTALQKRGLDDLTQAHLQALDAVARQALEARATIAPPAAPPSDM